MAFDNGKHKYWVGVLWIENLKDDWQESIGDILQLPYSGVIHNKDVDSRGDKVKDHLDLIIAFNNTTTYNHALSVFDLLSADGKQAINTCQWVAGIRNRYDYQLHITDDCIKKGKHIYDASERIIGNGFDISAYEVLGLDEKHKMTRELADLIIDKGFTNFMRFYRYVRENYSDEYADLVDSKSGFFSRLTKGNYQEVMEEMEASSKMGFGYYVSSKKCSSTKYEADKKKFEELKSKKE